MERGRKMEHMNREEKCVEREVKKGDLEVNKEWRKRKRQGERQGEKRSRQIKQ